MTNPTGQTPTELLKEAIQLLNEVFNQPYLEWPHKVVELKNKAYPIIRATPQVQSVPPALTWEECVLILNGKGPVFIDDELAEAYARSEFLTKAAHLFMTSNREQRWIPVEERLPDVFEEVVVICEHSETKKRSKHILKLASDPMYPWINFTDDSVLPTVLLPVLWQPLPVVPEVTKQ